MDRPLKRIIHGLVCVFLVAGCQQTAKQGETTIYRFAPWVGIGVIAVGLLAIPAGWLLRRKSKEWGTALMILAPIALLCFAPAMFNDKVVVDPAHFEARYGFWFAPTVHNIAFADVSGIRCEVIVKSKRPTEFEMHVFKKDGSREIVLAGTLVRKAIPEILKQAKAKQIPVKDW